MPLTVPTTIFPAERRAMGIARELVPGTGVAPAFTVPVRGFVPEDKPIWLPDESLRASMALTYGLIQGPYMADVTIDASPVYGDTIGHFLLNVLGDYQATGSTPTSATTVALASSAGATSFVVGAIGTIVIGSVLQFGNATLGTAPTENLIVSNVAGTTVTFATTPLRFAHTAGAAVAIVVAPFTHTFALLNGTGNAQPNSHTLTDINFINGSVGSRWYPFSCFSEVTFTGNAEQLFQWQGKAVGFANSIPGGTPVVSVSAVPAQPVWRSTVGLGGTIGTNQIYQIGEWSYTLTRQVEPYFTADGSQNPYVIGRGKFSVTGKMNFMPTIDETPLTNMLSNTQPQVQILQTNNLGGASTVSLQFDTQLTAFDASVIEPTKALFGYNNNFQAVANTTNVGGSAGYSPIKCTLINAFSAY